MTVHASFDTVTAASPDGVALRARILLAEDNPIASDLISMMVRRLGHDIDRVANGLDAVDAVERAVTEGEPYALVLLDAMMPVLTGVEAARRIRSGGTTPRDLPIIAVTAATDPAEVREYLGAGMQGYLAKPVSLADLSGCIDAWAPGRGSTFGRDRSQPSAALRRRYDLRKTEVLERFQMACEQGECSANSAAELREHLHKLAGTAGSFGERHLSEAAAKGEALLVTAPPADVRGAIERCHTLLKAVC